MAKKRKTAPCSHCHALPGDAFVLVEYDEAGEHHVEKLESGWCWPCHGIANLSTNLTMAGLLFHWRNEYLKHNP